MSDAFPGAAVWHRFVSPHYDDIALSCGGTVARLAAAGFAPEIVVVFGDQPDPAVPLSPFATQMHDGWGLGAADAIAARRREEAVAAALLGATSRVLPFLDAIYRGDAYTGDDVLFAPPPPHEAGLPSRVAAALASDEAPTPAVRWYAPLAVGDHADHRHVFAAASALAGAGWDVWFYEDLPYAINPGSVERRLEEIAAAVALEPAATVAVGEVWETKLEAVLAYPSQLATIFRYVGTGADREGIDRAMRGYAARAGAGRLGERFWRLAGSDVAGTTELSRSGCAGGC